MQKFPPTTNKTKTLFFVKDRRSIPYIERDYQILQEKFPLGKVYFSLKKESPFINLKVLFKIAKYSLLFFWFGHSDFIIPFLLAKLLRKKTIFIAGGYETTYVPEINYGLMKPGIRKFITKLMFTLADKVIAVSNYTQFEILRYMKLTSSRLTRIYHGFEIPPPHSFDNKENLILTVSTINSIYLRRKNLETFVKAATYLPQTKFAIVGTIEEHKVYRYLQSISPNNLIILNHLSYPQLIQLFAKAKIYVQISFYESFGCALAEAMSYGCIPIASRAGAIPEVVGDAGIYIEKSSPEELADKIKEALKRSYLGNLAHLRITQRFSLKLRSQSLIAVIKEVMTS